MNDSTNAESSPRRRGPHQDPGESLFAPDSLSWRLHADPLIGLASLRALLLQALHPVVADALDQHSSYGNDPWARLERLTEYLGVTTYGAATAAMLHGSRVRAVHARITGRTGDGVTYQADDPQLLAWMHCCLVASVLEIVTRGGAGLSGAEQDAYVAEQVRSAMLVGLEPDEVPHDRAGLHDYYRVIRPLLSRSPCARQAVELVVDPGSADPPTRFPGRRAGLPAWAPVAGLAYAALPPWARRLYAIDDPPGPAGLPDAATTTALRALRAAAVTP